MKQSILYGLLNALLGLLLGVFVSCKALGSGYYIFIIIAPISAFGVSSLLWKLIINEKKKSELGKILGMGIATSVFSFYFSFIFAGLFFNIYYWISGCAIGSMNDKPAGLFDLLTGAFAFSFFGIVFWGWITIPLSIAIGLIIKKKYKNAN